MTYLWRDKHVDRLGPFMGQYRLFICMSGQKYNCPTLPNSHGEHWSNFSDQLAKVSDENGNSAKFLFPDVSFWAKKELVNPGIPSSSNTIYKLPDVEF